MLSTAFRLANVGGATRLVGEEYKRLGFTVLIVEVCLSCVRMSFIVEYAKRRNMNPLVMAGYSLFAEFATNSLGVITSFFHTRQASNPTIKYISERRLVPISTIVEVALLYFMYWRSRKFVLILTMFAVVLATALSQTKFDVILSDFTRF
eukprot:4330355-Pleurochrysis_carterae.AAC.1